MSLYTYLHGTVFYSLIRFSTRKQADGDSFRRQITEAETFALAEDIPLDKSLHETDIRKLGMSAFSGTHVIKGPIRKFLAGIESGTVKPGLSVLLVSEWNRLTRQISSDALKLTLDLMERGVGIIDLQDRAYYTLDRYNGDVGLQLSLQLKISMAYQYSANLRRNSTSAWKAKQDAIIAGTGKRTNACPEWLSVDAKGEWAIDATKIKTIKLIRDYRFDKMGQHAIARRLNNAGIPSFRGGTWHGFVVTKLVRNRALIGWYTPCDKHRKPVGPETRHYPAVLSEDDFYRMQWTKVAAPRGRPSRGMKNLLAEIVHCGVPGCVTLAGNPTGFRHLDKGKRGGGEKLVCAAADRHACSNRVYHDYVALEHDLLDLLGLFDYTRLFNRADPQIERLSGLRAQIAEKTAILDSVAEDFKTGMPRAFALRAQREQDEIDSLTATLIEVEQAARIAEANKQESTYAEFRSLVETARDREGEERELLRRRLANELHRVLAEGIGVGDRISFWVRTIDYPHATFGYPKIEIIAVKSEITEIVIHSPSGSKIRFGRGLLTDNVSFEKVVSGYHELAEGHAQRIADLVA